jgi:Na+-transporting methylmalonyl-CoA/oxaloacetate decarboxylase gamma subunit
MQVGQTGHLLAWKKKHQEVSADNCSHPLRISLAIVKNTTLKIMKNIKNVLSLLIVITLSVSAFAQETPVLASANTNDKEKKKKEAQKSEEVKTTTEAAEEEETAPTFTLSGSIDTYFHSSFGYRNGGTVAPSTSFANLKGFSLGMANLIASYNGEKSGFVADLVFGPRGSDAVFNSELVLIQILLVEAVARSLINCMVIINSTIRLRLTSGSSIHF